jgi:hypothetical protein
MATVRRRELHETYSILLLYQGKIQELGPCKDTRSRHCDDGDLLDDHDGWMDGWMNRTLHATRRDARTHANNTQ